MIRSSTHTAILVTRYCHTNFEGFFLHRASTHNKVGRSRNIHVIYRHGRSTRWVERRCIIHVSRFASFPGEMGPLQESRASNCLQAHCCPSLLVLMSALVREHKFPVNMVGFGTSEARVLMMVSSPVLFPGDDRSRSGHGGGGYEGAQVACFHAFPGHCTSTSSTKPGCRMILHTRSQRAACIASPQHALKYLHYNVSSVYVSAAVCAQMQ